MQVRTDRGWIRAGLAVLVTGVLGGGMLAAAGGSRPAQKVTAEGMTAEEGAPVPSGDGFDLGGVRPAGADQAPAANADPSVGDKVPMGDGSVTVLAVEDNVSAGRLFGAGKGFKYIAAEVKGCSGPNEKNITFEPAYFLLRLDDGTIRDPGVDAKKPSLEGGTVPPGKCLSGWVTFTVPEGALPTGVIYDGSVRTTWTVPVPENATPTTTTTLRAGATTSTTEGDSGGDEAGGSTTTKKPKSTSTTSKSTATTSKSTATTARSSTATTSRSTATTSKSTTTTGKSSASSTTGTTAKSSASTTTTSAKPSGSTTSTSTSGASTSTTTTGR